jgi:late competence protein required for DNA uptake (superfamily II DNA/RNA helicase)
MIDEAQNQIYQKYKIIKEYAPHGLSVECRQAIQMLRNNLSKHLTNLMKSSWTREGMTSWKSTLEDVIFKQFTKEMPGVENFMIEAVNKAIKSCLVFANAIQIYRSKQEIASETNPAQTDMSCMVNGGDPLCVSNQYFVQTTRQRHT